MVPGNNLSEDEWTRLADFRYQVRRFLRFSETLTRENGVSPLQPLLVLQLKGIPGQDWASISDLAERLQVRPFGILGAWDKRFKTKPSSVMRDGVKSHDN